MNKKGMPVGVPFLFWQIGRHFYIPGLSWCLTPSTEDKFMQKSTGFVKSGKIRQ